MFRLVPERTAWWPVIFAGVTEEGRVVDNKIELRFRILDEDQVLDFHAQLEGLHAAAVEAKKPVLAKDALPVLRTVVMDWRGVGGANGEGLPFSDDSFLTLLKVPNAAVAIGAAYQACRNAAPETRQGN